MRRKNLRTAVLLLVLQPVGCAPASAPRTEAPQPMAIPRLDLTPLPEYRRILDCGAQTTEGAPCRIPEAPTIQELDQHLSGGRGAVWVSGNRWTAAYRVAGAAVSRVELSGGIQLPMSRIEATDTWVLSLRLPGAERGVISLSVLVERGEALEVDTVTFRTWRGPAAPEPPQAAGHLAGTLRIDSIWSESMGMRRGVTVYLPPGHRRDQPLPVIYLTDGQNVKWYAPIIDTLIAQGALPPVVLVGVWVASGSTGGGPARGLVDDLRAIEYHAGIEGLPGTDSAFVVKRHVGHKSWFTDEVRRWAEDSLGVRTERRWRAVQGASSGGSYALTLGRERPDLYGTVIAFSTGGSTALVPPSGGWAAASSHYLAAGALEPQLVTTLTALSDTLRRNEVPNVLQVYPSGHDFGVWRELLPHALAWWLKGQGG